MIGANEHAIIQFIAFMAMGKLFWVIYVLLVLLLLLFASVLLLPLSLHQQGWK